MNVHRAWPLIACFLWLRAPPLRAQDRSPDRQSDRQEDESTQEEGKSQREILTERRREKAWNLSPYRVSGAEDRLIRLEDVKFPLNIFEGDCTAYGRSSVACPWAPGWSGVWDT